jgi:hypothetical protein
MRNRALAADYARRAALRLRALALLFDAEGWADVVREAQETVELALKGLLMSRGIEPPRLHDVSDVLLAESDRLPVDLRPEVQGLALISKELRRDRELAFYGAEDLTPSGFYRREDAARALEQARRVVELVTPHIPQRPA